VLGLLQAQTQNTTPPSREQTSRLAAPSQNPLGRWPPARLATANFLWGKGFTLAGGEAEVLQLARPLGLSAASSLLLIGGGGGAACGIVRNLGAWVTALEAEHELVAEAKALMKAAEIGSKARIDTWDPQNPRLPRGHHHCLAIEPLRAGGQPEPLIDALSQSVKPGGQLMMIELVADAPLPADDPTVARWARLESRLAEAVPNVTALTRTLTRLGFDVRIAEDISSRHMRNVLLGWKTALRALQDDKPTALAAAHLVAEAEAWLLRLRLLRRQQLRLMRWHALARGSSAQGASPRT
jgi:cyclopropane fatty-acyl-phospholipid synthase-like methyltransferase